MSRRRTYITEQGLDLIEAGDEGLARFGDGEITTDDIQFALFAFQSVKTKGALLADVGDALERAGQEARAALYGEPVARDKRKAADRSEASAA